jgi:hypothetical protein
VGPAPGIVEFQCAMRRRNGFASPRDSAGGGFVAGNGEVREWTVGERAAAFPSIGPDLSRQFGTGPSGVRPQCLRCRQGHEPGGQNSVVNLASQFDFIGHVRARSSWALDDPCGINCAVPAEVSRLTRGGPFGYDWGRRYGHRVQRVADPLPPRRHPSRGRRFRSGHTSTGRRLLAMTGGELACSSRRAQNGGSEPYGSVISGRRPRRMRR